MDKTKRKWMSLIRGYPCPIRVIRDPFFVFSTDEL